MEILPCYLSWRCTKAATPSEPCQSCYRRWSAHHPPGIWGRGPGQDTVGGSSRPIRPRQNAQRGQPGYIGDISAASRASRRQGWRVQGPPAPPASPGGAEEARRASWVCILAG